LVTDERSRPKQHDEDLATEVAKIAADASDMLVGYVGYSYFLLAKALDPCDLPRAATASSIP
jgi:hypothetical protein